MKRRTGSAKNMRNGTGRRSMAKRTSKETKTGAGDGEAEGFALHPRFTEALSGHSAAEETFLRAFNAGALHHAWLVTGERGIGKATFAYRAARFLLSRDAAAPIARRNPRRTAKPPGRAANRGWCAFLAVRARRSARHGGGGLDWRGRGATLALLPEPDEPRRLARDDRRSGERSHHRLGQRPAQGHRGAAGAHSVLSHRSWRLDRDADHPLALREACVAAAWPRRFLRGSPGCLRGGGHRPAGRPSARKAPQDFRGLAGPRRWDSWLAGCCRLPATLDKLLKSMPRTDYGLVHSLIQSASGARNAQTFVKLCDLIEERLEALAREGWKGQRPRQKAPPGLKPGKTSGVPSLGGPILRWRTPTLWEGASMFW